MPNGTYQWNTPAPVGGCVTQCAGCQWKKSVVVSSSNDQCVFDWNVTRHGCTNNPDQTFSGQTVLECDDDHTEQFPCGGGCIGLELEMHCECD